MEEEENSEEELAKCLHGGELNDGRNEVLEEKINGNVEMYIPHLLNHDH